MPNPVRKRRLARLVKQNKIIGNINYEELNDYEVEPEIEPEVEPEVELELELEPEIESDVEMDYSEEKLQILTKADLIQIAEKMNIDTSGKKSEIINRILGD